MVHSELVIPLPTHRPLHSYTAAELYLAGHRAASTERNINSPHPQLRSSRDIRWPYEPSPGVELGSDLAQEERGADAVYMHLSHPNGKWMFTISRTNVLVGRVRTISPTISNHLAKRILNLRSGRLALTYDGEAFESDVSSALAWAVEFKEDDKALLVMNCPFWTGDEEMWENTLCHFSFLTIPPGGNLLFGYFTLIWTRNGLALHWHMLAIDL